MVTASPTQTEGIDLKPRREGSELEGQTGDARATAWGNRRGRGKPCAGIASRGGEHEPKPAGLMKTFEASGIVAEVGGGWTAEAKHTADASDIQTRMLKVQQTPEVVNSEPAATPDSNEAERSESAVEFDEETTYTISASGLAASLS